MRPTWSMLAALGAAALCAGTVAWTAFGEHRVVDPGAPRTAAAPVVRLEAALPDIGPFSAYQVNQENPFIPVNLRKSERESLTRSPQSTAPVPAAAPAAPPLPKPLPRLSAPLDAPPRTTGVITLPDGGVQVGVAAGGGQRLLAVGEAVEGWTLIGVEHGAVVVWRDPEGETVHDLLGGVAGATAAVVVGATPAPPKQGVPARPAAPGAGKAPPRPGAPPVGHAGHPRRPAGPATRPGQR